MTEPEDPGEIRRPGKEWVERLLAGCALVVTAPLFAVCAAAIKLEGWLDPHARGPVFFAEDRVARGRIIRLLKFRTLPQQVIDDLGDGPTHIARIEMEGGMTRAGRIIKDWYLDELPQLLNVVRGDMGLIGTRPYPVDLYEEELARGITRKRDMPAGLVGPVQASKGDPDSPEGVALDAAYFAAYRTWPWWRLALWDLKILWRSLAVQARHEGL